MLDLHPSIARLLALPDAQRRIGPFVLLRQLGRGGFAPVWLAKEVYEQETLRPAAVKIFALMDGDADASRRIVEEAIALCRVEHRNVVRFYSLAVDENAGLMGLGMEYIAGRSLAARLSVAGPMRVEQVVELGITLASALAAVHRAGLVHRDVKPANIIETTEGYKLIDFGIASANTHFSEAPTWIPSNDPDCTARDAASQSGTLGYVDPVTIAIGTLASPEIDLYALGATLYECVTGRLPAGTRNNGLDAFILDGRETPQSVAHFAKKMPAALATVIDRMVHPDRICRYGSADEVLVALQRIRARPNTQLRYSHLLAATTSIIAIASGIGTYVIYQRALRAEAVALQHTGMVVTEDRRELPSGMAVPVEVVGVDSVGAMPSTARIDAPMPTTPTIPKSAPKKEPTKIIAEPSAARVNPEIPPIPAPSTAPPQKTLPLLPAREW